MAPPLGVSFTASLDSSCNLTTATTLAIGTHIQGPGIPSAGVSGNDAHITGASSPYSMGIGGCTAQTSQVYATGAMNPTDGSGNPITAGAQGTYNGWLWPKDNAGVISFNNPATVFNPSAMHAPAT